MIEAMATAARRQDVRDSLEQYFRAHVTALAGGWQRALDQLERTSKRQAFYYSIDPAFDAARLRLPPSNSRTRLSCRSGKGTLGLCPRVKASGPAAAQLAVTRDIDGLSKVTSATLSAMLTATRNLHQSQEEKYTTRQTAAAFSACRDRLVIRIGPLRGCLSFPRIASRCDSPRPRRRVRRAS